MSAPDFELEFLEAEGVFLKEVNSSLTLLSGLSIGQRFSDEILDTVERLQHTIQQRNDERRVYRERVTRWRGNVSDTSTDSGRAELRQSILGQTVETQRKLRTVMLHLAESQAIVSAVLESVLETVQDEERYDSQGKAVPAHVHVKGRQVA